MGGKRGRLIPQHERRQAVELIEEACASGAIKFKACEILSISLRTLERWQKPNGNTDKRRAAAHTPTNKLSAAERQQVLEIANSTEFCNLPPTQIVPKLADLGKYYASESTFYRILREAELLQHRAATKPCKHAKPRELIAIAPNQVWSWDITYLLTAVKGIYYYLYLFVDIFSRKIVGWSIHEAESAVYAADLVKQIYLDENVNPWEVWLHSDNGSPMKGATMLETLRKLGVSASFSRPSVSDDNPFSESLFKTMKYRSNYPSKPFIRIEEAIDWVEKFVRWYNYEHCHSSIKFVTPNQRHTGADKKILIARKSVYELAKQNNPQRWRGDTRNWRYIDKVILNSSNPVSAIITACS